MNNLKPCPCGWTPSDLIVVPYKYCRYLVIPDCDHCDDWAVCIRVGSEDHPDEISELAEEAWNAAPRGNE